MAIQNHDECGGRASDEALVVAVLRGRKEAYGDLYDRYARLVRAICYNATHDLFATQDLTQEVFLRAYRKLAELRQPNRFGGWLVSISRFVCREWRRSRGRDRHRFNHPAPECAASRNSDDHELDRLHFAMQKLTEKQRLALHVFYSLEQPPEQACKVLGVSRTRLYALLQQARRRLRSMLQQEDLS